MLYDSLIRLLCKLLESSVSLFFQDLYQNLDLVLNGVSKLKVDHSLKCPSGDRICFFLGVVNNLLTIFCN